MWMPMVPYSVAQISDIMALFWWLMYDFHYIGPRNSQWQTKGFEEAERIIWWDGSVGLFVKPYESYVSTLSSLQLIIHKWKKNEGCYAGCGASGI